jgi:hypothetical protein
MSNFSKLLDLTDYADAKPILETVPTLSNASWTLAQTAYQIKETQPQVARNFLKTVIKEMDDEEKKVEETDGGSDTQSSSTTGLEKIGSESGDGESSVKGAANTNDQMGVAIGEMAPPMGGAPPQQVPPQIPPQVPQQPQQQMQYTIQEATAIRGQFAKIAEAIKALDTKITETVNSQTKSLDIGTAYKGETARGSFIRETTGDAESDLQKTRGDLAKLNDAINKGA